MPTYDIDFEANGQRQRLSVEGDRPPTQDEASQLILQALGNPRRTPIPTVSGPPLPTQTLFGAQVPLQPPRSFAEVRAAAQQPGQPQAHPPTAALPMAGQIGGELAGSLVEPGAGTALGGAVGATLGKAAQIGLEEGRFPTSTELGTEALLTLAPELAESGLRAVGRTMLRNTPGGQRIRFDEAARQARTLAPEVFQPMSREDVGNMFTLVRNSGVKVDTQQLAHEVTTLNAGKYDALLSEVRRIDNAYKTGGRYTSLVESLRGNLPKQVGYDIGDLQQFRSAVRQRVQQLEPVEAKQLLRDLQNAIDDTIDTGLARGRTPLGNEPQVLQQARTEWARLRASEDMGHLVEQSITSSPDLAMNSFNLRQFFDKLRRGDSEITTSVNRALERTPGARLRFEQGLADISRQFQTIELPLADVSGFRRNALVAGIGQAISSVLLTDTGRHLFREAIILGRGSLSPNILALITSAARREAMPQPAPDSAQQPHAAD